MKRFILNLSFCLVIALCSILLIGCFGKKEEPVAPETTAEESAPSEEQATPSEEEGTPTATEEAPAGEKG
ncbi:hypothetical protein KKG61_09210 [bacterium]|nr:hypothetical protein [bacterium]MBU1600261.1 hypothetical protein [bacterium]MBU2462151.1 hypothetical protein [bacterium]